MSNENVYNQHIGTVGAVGESMPQTDVSHTTSPVNSVPLPITSLNALRSYANGTVVRLPDFGDGQPLVARVCRPSLLVMAKSGKIPNHLLTQAGSMFVGGTNTNNINADTLGEMYDLCRVIAEATLLEPTLDQIVQSGLTLTDDQMMSIFQYTQSGVKALEDFRS